MKQPGRSWHDLRPRLLTGLALVIAGIAVILLGGPVFAITAAVVTGVMVWELAQMIAADKTAEATQAGVIATAAVLLARNLPEPLPIPLLIAPAVAGAVLLRTHRALFAGYALAIVLACFALADFRDQHGVTWLLWLVLVVVVTDIAGYFGGRLIGGPKFWPGISPKKTWSGIICGWLAAALLGAVFVVSSGAGANVIWVSMVLSFASQLGDIAESAIKRRMGVKDSSHLLPGHGGVLDRFDALMGATLFMLLAAQLVEIPGLRF